MRKTLSLLGVLMLVAFAAQAQQPAQSKGSKTKTTATTPSATSSGDSAMTNHSDAKAVDINTASRAELIDGGWGQYADGIIASRPYTSMDQLSNKNIVPRAAFDEGAAKFSVGSQDGNDSPLQNQSPPAASASSMDVSTPKDATGPTTAIPGSTAPSGDSTATPSR